MGLNCGCPAAASLPTMTIPDCKESFGQIQKVIFQRIYSGEGVKNKMTAATALLKVTYTANLSATDGTKMLISPIINNPETEPGEARMFGGGNQTAGGIEVIIGTDPTNFTGTLYQESQTSTIKPLKQLMCENIGVYLIDEYGNIGGIEQPGATAQAANDFLPIPIQKFFIGDKKLGGFEEPDSNTIQWAFNPNWSDDLVIYKRSTLDFDPLTDLVNA